MRAAAVITAVLLAAGCAGPQVDLTAHVNAIDAYRAYGDYHPPADDAAVVARAASADVRTANIRIIQEALPAGIVMSGQALAVSDGYHHRLIGKYAYSPGSETTKGDLLLHVKKMVATTGGNAAIVLFQMENADRERAQAVEAVLVWLDPAADPTVTTPVSVSADDAALKAK